MVSPGSPSRIETAPPADAGTWAHHIRATLRIGAPLVAAQLTQQAIQVTDTVMLGWLGPEPLAASVLAHTLFFLCFIAGTGFALAVMPLTATAAAEGDDRAVRRVVRMGLWVGALVVACLLVPLGAAGAIFTLLGQEPALIALAKDYLWIAQWSLFPAVLVMVLRSHLAAMERTQVVMWATLAGAVLNGILNWALIFGNWGAPALGMQGAAIATVGTHTLILLVLIAYCRLAPEIRRQELFVRLWRADWAAFWQVLRMGLPISGTLLAEVGLFGASSLMMGWLGTIPLAAHGIALQIISVIFMIPMSLASAGTVRIGRAVGRRDPAGLDRAAKTVLALSVGVAVAGAILILAIPGPLIRLFLDEAEPAAVAIVATGSTLLAVAAIFQVVDSLQVVSVGLLRGLKDTARPLLIAVLSYWGAGLPTAYVLGFVIGLGGIGVWLGLAIGLALAATLLTRRFLRRGTLGLEYYA